MNATIRLIVSQCARARAHLAGAEALYYQQRALDFQARGDAARRRYYRELASIDHLNGEPSPFEGLGS